MKYLKLYENSGDNYLNNKNIKITCKSLRTISKNILKDLEWWEDIENMRYYIKIWVTLDGNDLSFTIYNIKDILDNNNKLERLIYDGENSVVNYGVFWDNYDEITNFHVSFEISSNERQLTIENDMRNFDSEINNMIERMKKYSDMISHIDDLNYENIEKISLTFPNIYIKYDFNIDLKDINNKIFKNLNK